MYKKRLLEKTLLEIIKYNKVVLITGARQVGKSTLLKNLFPECPHITFDSIQDSYGVRQDPDLFLKNFKAPLILDEVQFVPELLSSLKRAVDLNDFSECYYLTGSQNFSLLKTISESLAGRVACLSLYPMTFLELHGRSTHWLEGYLKRDSDFYKNLFPVQESAPLYETLWRGGMPGLIGRDNEAVPNYFLSYMQTYIERDIRTMSNIENFQDFNFFVRLLSALTAQKINAAQLGREIGISNNTATKWKNLLLGTYLWLELPPYSKNLIKRVSKKPKGYMLDTGLACYLQRLSSPNALAEHPNRGAMFETYCVNQIYGYLQSKLHQPMLYHWRSANQAEVDVVLEQDGWLFPIEIKCKTTIDPYDLRGIKAFKDAYPQEKIYMGVVLYAGDVVRLLTKDIVAIPWNFLPQN